MSEQTRLIEVVEAYLYFLKWGRDNEVDIPDSFHERVIEIIRTEAGGEAIGAARMADGREVA